MAMSSIALARAGSRALADAGSHRTLTRMRILTRSHSTTNSSASASTASTKRYIQGLSGAAAVWFAFGQHAAASTDPVAAPADDEEAAAGTKNTGSAASGTPRPAARAAAAAAADGRPADAVAMARELFTVAASEYAGQLSVGAITGFCSGYALKKVSKVAAVVVGLGFIGFQVARYHGVVQSPDWQAVDDKLVAALDANGDGVVDLEDMQVHLAKVTAYLSVGLPSAGAFGVAFLLGLKSG